MPNDEIQTKIDEAINKLLTKDKILLQNDSSERAITHKLACYLEEHFPEWDIDCEYNRNMLNVKMLKDTCRSSDNNNGSPVLPDIIIHKRMTNENYIVIEVKKTTNPETDDCDKQKLLAFRNELGYTHGLFIRFKTGCEDIKVEYKKWLY